MRRIVYFLFSLMVISTACDPLEETYKELDAAPTTTRVTLSNSNYQSLRGQTNVPSYVTSSYYFKSEEEAAVLIPLFLNPTYGRLDEGDKVDVTYNTLVADLKSSVSERVSYTLTAREDYALGGTSYSNFDSWAQIETFLNAKYPTPREGRLATLTFTWYNGNAAYPNPNGGNPVQSKTVTDSYFYSGGKWYDTYVVTNEDYASIDRNRNNAFTSADEASFIPSALNKFLKQNIVGAKAGNIQYASYSVRYSSSSTLVQVMPMVYNGTDWIKASALVVQPATITFIKKQGVWVADIAVKYTMERADYTWISQQSTLGTASQLSNLGSFGNFYQASSSSANYWSDANIQTALAALLKYKFPNAEVDKKYDVTYVYYAGSNRNGTFRFQKKSSGNFEYIRE